MLTRKKKGQISMEMLIVVGILVIGGVLFGTIYLGNIQSQSKKGDEFSSMVDDFMNEFGNWDDQGLNHISPILDHCSNGVKDVDETGIDCGGNDCFECPIPGELLIHLNLFPNTSSKVDEQFNIAVLLTNATGLEKAFVKEINIKDNLTNLNTNNCSFNGQYKSSFKDLDILINKDLNFTYLPFSCKEKGNYSFAIEAGIFDNDGPKNNDTKEIDKEINEIEPEPPEPNDDFIQFSVQINRSNKEENYFLNTSYLNLNTILYPENKGEIDSCLWYVNNKELENIKSCNIVNLLLSNEIFNEGINTIEIYVERSKNTASKVLTARDSIRINIYKNSNLNDNILLFTPSQVFVGENFKVRAYTSNQDNLTKLQSELLFNFTNNKCNLLNFRSFIEGCLNIDDTTIYYRDYDAVCNYPNYSQIGNHEPQDIELKLNNINSESQFFKSIYDLSIKNGNCQKNNTSYGSLFTCLFLSNGVGYNEDYWSNSSFGFLKTNIDIAYNSVENDYGVLEIYIE